MEIPDDEILMLSVKAGEFKSLTPLFRKYNVKIYNFFLRLTYYDIEASEDLTQNLFYRILLYRHTFKEGNSFKTWLYQLARNLSSDYHKNKKKFIKAVEAPDNIISTNNSILEDIEFNEQRIQLLNVLNKLPKDQREIIELSRFQNLKYAEIMDITGYSIEAIKVKVYRAMKQLKKYMK